MATDYGLPQDKLFYRLSEVKKTGFASVEQLKQNIYKGRLKAVKNGNQWRIPRAELIRFISEGGAA